MLIRNYFLVLLLLLSCQNSSQTQATSSNCNSPIIIGNNDWINYLNTGNDQQNANENTVGQIKIPKLMAACTAFLINEDTVMTNHHCIGSSSDAVGVKIFLREITGERISYMCDEFIMTSVQYDFTLVKCTGFPGRKFGWVGLSKTKPQNFEPIYVVQENCDYIKDPYCVVNKEVAFGDILKSLNSQIYHNADTLPGSSGSPIFSVNSQQVIGIHNAGSPATVTNPDMNMGVPMNKIQEEILNNSNVVIYEFGTEKNISSIETTPTTPSIPTTAPIGCKTN